MALDEHRASIDQALARGKLAGERYDRLAKLNPTPVIDTLARDGMLFENAFCTNSICVPSRACIMTGQYNNINGALTLGGRLAPRNQYLAIEMKKAG